MMPFSVFPRIKNSNGVQTCQATIVAKIGVSNTLLNLIELDNPKHPVMDILGFVLF